MNVLAIPKWRCTMSSIQENYIAIFNEGLRDSMSAGWEWSLVSPNHERRIIHCPMRWSEPVPFNWRDDKAYMYLYNCSLAQWKLFMESPSHGDGLYNAIGCSSRWSSWACPKLNKEHDENCFLHNLDMLVYQIPIIRSPPSCALARNILGVLKAMATSPEAETATTPPIFSGSFSWTTLYTALPRGRSLYSIMAATSFATVCLMNSSPRPVPDTPQRWFAYVPAPIMGVSPVSQGFRKSNSASTQEVA